MSVANKGHRLLVLSRSAVVLGIAVVACAPAPPPLPSGGPAAEGQSAVPAAGGPTRVTIANGVDVKSLATKLGPGGPFAADYHFMSNSPLVVFDPKGAFHPRLAAELPSQGRGTWTVNPDGTMATTWKIRPNAVWHDGQPVKASDFAFALRVYLDDALDIRSREPERFIDWVELLDNKTFTIHWKRVYTLANQLIQGQLEPLPEHAVGSLYEAGDKEAFLNASFWSSTSYVGNGPYVLAEWQQGVQLVYRAFDQYYLGRPKIDEVTIRVITDANTVAAHVLSGTVDATAGLTLTLPPRIALQQQWDQTREGDIYTTPTFFVNLQVQHDPSRTQQPAILDLRVRRALVHGLDRVTIAEVISEGTGPAADVLMTPADPLYPRVERAMAKYPFDLTRALALLQEAGWTKRGDTLVNASGQPFTTDITIPEVAGSQTHATLIQAGWSAVGIQASLTSIPQPRMRDPEFRATFPGVRIYGNRLEVPRALVGFTWDECPRAENRFFGANGGCWNNADFDRFFRIATISLDEREQADAVVHMFRTITEDVGTIPMSYHPEHTAVRKGLMGPGARWPGQNGTTWNVHEWRWS